MTLKDIQTKIANGETLTDEDKKFIAEYDERKLLDAEAKKARQKAEGERDAFKTQLDELKAKSEEDDSKKKTEKDTTDARIKALEKKAENAEKESAALKRSSAIRELAAENGVTLAAGTMSEKVFARIVEEHVGNTKLDDEEAVKAVFESFKKDNPGIIAAPSGGGANVTGSPSKTAHTGPNPFSKKTQSLDKAIELQFSDPELAKKLKAEADAEV